MIFLILILMFMIAPDPAHAEPLSAWIISTWTITSTVGQAVVRIAVGLAASALSNLLAKKDNGGGIRTDSQTAGDTTPQSFILGRYATAGNLVAPMMSQGPFTKTPNAFLTQVIDLGDVPVTELTDIYIDGEHFPIETDSVWVTGTKYPEYGDTPDSSDKPNHADRAFYIFHDGTQTTADAMLLSKFGSYPERPWTSDMIGRGIPYVIMTYLYKQDVYQSIPQAFFAVKGIKLYDPRLDTTAGGSGSHRWNDTSTWEFSSNLAVMIYNIMRGIPLLEGDTYGCGIHENKLPFAVWTAAMDVCDQDIGGSPRYHGGYEVLMGNPEDGGDVPWDVIDVLKKGCSAELCDVGGTWIIRCGEPGIAVAAITDGDIIVTDPQDYNPYPEINSTYNAIKAQYPEPTELWELKDAPTRYDLDAEAEDGTRLLANVQLKAVSDANQVQRLMAAWLKDARRMRTHTIVLPPDYNYLQPLDTIEWTSEHNLYADKLFEIGSKAIDPITLTITLSIREVDPDDYDPDITIIAPVFTSPVKVIYTGFTIPGLAFSAIVTQDGLGNDRYPAILIEWDDELTGIQAITWECRLKSTGDMVNAGSTSNVFSGQAIVASGLLPDLDYEIRARGINLDTSWSSWVTIHTAETDLITAADLEGKLDPASFASNIKPVEIVATLPGIPHVQGRMVFLTSDNKLYRNTGSGWTAVVPAADITGTLTNSQIADLAAAKLTGQIVSTQITDNAVTTAKINAGAVSTAKLAASAVTANEIASNAITSAKINAGAITTAKLAAGAVTANELAANSVIAGKIAAAAVSTSELAANAVTAAKIGAGEINAAKIATDTLIRSLFASGVLQIPLLIDIEARSVSASTQPFKHSGLVRVTLIGGGGSGAAASMDAATEGAASGGGAGGLVTIFLPNSGDFGTWSFTAGAAGAGILQSPTNNTQNGANGSGSTFTTSTGPGGAISITAGGGQGGKAGVNPTWGVAAAATGGSYGRNAAAIALFAKGYDGGSSVAVNATSNNKRATGGGAVNVNISGIHNGQGGTDPGQIMAAYLLALSTPPLPFTSLISPGGTDGKQSNSTATPLLSDDAPYGSGSGGAAATQSNAESGDGGGGLLIIEYFGDEALK